MSLISLSVKNDDKSLVTYYNKVFYIGHEMAAIDIIKPGNWIKLCIWLDSNIIPLGNISSQNAKGKLAYLRTLYCNSVYVLGEIVFKYLINTQIYLLLCTQLTLFRCAEEIILALLIANMETSINP